MRKLLILLAILTPGLASALPDEYMQEGLLVDANGVALAGAHDLTVRLYAAAQGGAPLFSEVHRQVDLFEGYYAIAVGSVQPLPAGLFERPSLYMGFSIDGGAELAPRTPLKKVPAAFVANVARNVTGDITPTTVSIGGQQVINENGEWVGNPTGLRGPAGPAGPAGDVDEDAIVNGMLAILAADPGRLPYLSSAADDTAEGNTITMDGGRLVFRAGAIANSLQLGNNNIIGVNAMRFNDAGFTEGIQWDGTLARIAVSPLNNADGDGYLRLINDGGISLEDNTRVQGNLTITGAIDAVQSITATVITATTATLVNANITNLNGPGNRVSVQGELNLLGDVRLAANTSFIGTLRAGGLITGGDIEGRNILANGSIQAAGNIEAGNLLRAGPAGIWVQGVQVFDGNGNLLRRPSYACPAGRVMMGTDANGFAVCGNVTCPVGQYFRGLDGAGNAICAADEGLRALPAQVCPDGQAVLRVAANGTTTCGSPRAGEQVCPEGEFVTGLTPEGSVICAEGAVGDGGGGGQCAAGEVRPNIYVCTNSGRSVQTFIPAGFNFNIVVGRCDPDANTQAMLVTRGGGGEAAGRAAQWAQYVEGGGNIITEYNVSHLVFNAIFGGGAVQGPRRGGCHDNAMPPVKVNVDDPFWRANPALQVVPPAEAPCGYEVGAFPGVTPLGGWAENQISLAYRDKGAGRLWLVDADWQDNENYWLPQSSGLMGAMITWCGGAGGGDDGDALVFNGVRTNVPEGEVVGWRECHRSLYGQGGLSMAQVLAQCDGDQIMYGCQANGAGKWQVLAQGARAAVFRDIGQANNPTVDNGVGWYFSTTWSLGFAPAGQPISRNSCDTENGLADQRICWHSSNGNMDGGWRCGANTGLNGNNGFTRVIWTRAAGGGGGGGGGEVALGANRGFGHHGACNGWNACGNAQTCANAACQMLHGTNAVRWQEGLCQDLARVIPGGMDCDLFAALPNNLDANWGNGCNIPVAYGVVCAAPGGGGGGGIAFQGVRENTPDANIGAAWRVCHTSTFGANVPGLTALLANACAGNRLMVGCRPVGSASWTLLAQGARAAVLANTGNGNATVRDNGVEWYYSNQWSMGFASQGDAVSRNSCDTQGGNGNLRMCWHTGGDALNSGYRCGNNFLNGNNAWERRIWAQ